MRLPQGLRDVAGKGISPRTGQQGAGRMTDTTGAERAKSRRIGALGALWPFIRPYRGMAALAGAALILTSAVSLILPMAVRRVVDGFNQSIQLLDQYFLAAIAIAGLLAVGTGMRYYFVTRLGERVVADLRRALFDRVLGMSPAFFERLLTGEVLSRITTDTTLILSVIGSSVSVALRNLLMLLGGIVLMALTSAQADRAGAAGRAAGGGADRGAGPPPAPPQPRKSGLDRQFLGQGVRGAGRGADGAGFHP